MGSKVRQRLGLVAVAAALTGAGCPTLHLPGPTDPPALESPRLVTVAIEYRQPNGCINVSTPCEEPVVFFATWMRPGGEFRLEAAPGTHIWRGQAYAVPVNFPPRDEPYEVRIFDPYMRESTTGGFTAQRLQVGAETISRIETPGGYDEHGLVYIDDNGHGRSPY